MQPRKTPKHLPAPAPWVAAAGRAPRIHHFHNCQQQMSRSRGHCVGRTTGCRREGGRISVSPSGGEERSRGDNFTRSRRRSHGQLHKLKTCQLVTAKNTFYGPQTLKHCELGMTVFGIKLCLLKLEGAESEANLGTWGFYFIYQQSQSVFLSFKLTFRSYLEFSTTSLG